MTWIIPKNSPISASAQDMMELERDSNLLASTLASTFLWRSKPTQGRVWSQRLKKVSWLQAFSTRILKPSLSESFEEKLISFLPDSHASRLVRPDSEGQTMTQDTSGHSSVTESMLADLPLFCSKMLTELSQHDLEGMTGQTQRERPFCSMSLENWKDWVTEQRQDASRRQKLVHHTNASDGSSCPTASSRDHKDCSDPRTWNCKESRVRNDQLARAVYFAADGHPDQDSHSLNGNRQGFADLRDADETHEKHWATPQASDHVDGARTAIESNQKCLGRDLARLDVQQGNWATPKSCDSKMPGKSGHPQLTHQVKDSAKSSGPKLNPRWVEALMGLEPGTVSIEPCTPTTCTNRTDELRMLGNGVVPQTCAVAVRVLMERLNSFNKSQQRTHNEQTRN